MIRYLFIFIILVVFASCSKEGKVEQDTTNAFFSLKRFAEKEVLLKKQSHIRIRKEVILNGNTEVLMPGEINWEDELRPLSINDINKSSWVDKFNSDTIVEGKNTSFIYTTADNKIAVKSVEVQLDSAQNVILIRLNTQQNNPLMTSSQEVVYRPAFGYKVSGKQKALILKESTYTIQAEFLQNTTLK